MKIKEGTCNKIRIINQQLNKIDEDLKRAFENDESILLELEQKNNKLNDYNNLNSQPQPSSSCNLLQLLDSLQNLNYSIKTVSEMQKCSARFINKLYNFRLTQKVTPNKKCVGLQDMIRGVIGDVEVKEKRYEKKGYYKTKL